MLFYAFLMICNNKIYMSYQKSYIHTLNNRLITQYCCTIQKKTKKVISVVLKWHFLQYNLQIYTDIVGDDIRQALDDVTILKILPGGDFAAE